MAEASGFRWTTLRVAALYPFALLLVFLSVVVLQTTSFPVGTRTPGGSAIIGLLCAGSTALVITRTLNLDWPAWAIGLAAYIIGGVAAACVFGYFELVRSEFPSKRE